MVPGAEAASGSRTVPFRSSAKGNARGGAKRLTRLQKWQSTTTNSAPDAFLVVLWSLQEWDGSALRRYGWDATWPQICSAELGH